MISANRRVLYGEVYNDIRCLSTDEKPTEDVKNGSVLVEIDTGTRYMYDAEASVWNELPTSGGGGGGGGTAGVASFNGRRGSVRPQAGDYTAALVNTSTAGKTVQQALDELGVAVQVDAALSPTSQHPVRNSAISAKFSEHEGKLVPAGGAAGAILAKATGSDHSLEWKSADEWMLTEDYDADGNGIVDEAELADAVKTGLHSATAADKGRDVTLMTDADKGIANGIVPLDSSRKILPEYLPDSIMAGLTYGGVFNATTRVVELTPAAKSILDVTEDTMTLENSSQIPEGYPANAELFYITTTGGTFADMTFAAGDWLISLSTSWKQLQSGNQVASVNAKTGAVVLDSDDVTQGIVNLYMRTTERAKLTDIEARATRDVNVIQSAAIMTDADDNDYLHLVNKNGSTTDFYGGSVDLTDYLQKDGDASEVYAPYTPASSRTSFTGNETLAQLSAKLTGWLTALEDIAFTADYDDIEQNKPTYNGVTLEGELVATDLGTLDMQEVESLPETPVANTLYVWHTTRRGEPWTRYLTYTTDWYEIETGGFEVIGVATDPETTPPTSDAIYVHRWTDAGSTSHTQVGIMLDGTYERLALHSDILTDYDELDGKPRIDTHELVSGNQTHESLGLVGKADIVPTATGKASGVEIVYGDATPSAPIVVTEINDSADMRYSTVHTSSNHYLNVQLDALNDALAGKLNLLFVDELPATPSRNTQYYVATETDGVFDIVIVDSVGTQHSAGTTRIDLDGIVYATRKVAGIALDADISATQIANATKAETVTLTNKTIDADDNTIQDLTTTNLKSGILATSVGASPTDTRIPSEKAVSDYAVKKTTAASKLYGTDGEGEAKAYTVSTALSSSSTDNAIPTAKTVYNFSVAKTANANKVYGTNGSGVAMEYTASGTYTSTASGQLLTRAGANDLYSNYCAVSNGTVTMASGWNGSITWARSGKVVTMYGSMNRTGSKVNSWAWTTLNASALPTNLRPKILSICPAFSDYTANVQILDQTYVNNEIQVTTAGLIQLNPRNNAGIQNGDFLYWSITYIVA